MIKRWSRGQKGVPSDKKGINFISRNRESLIVCYAVASFALGNSVTIDRAFVLSVLKTVAPMSFGQLIEIFANQLKKWYHAL